jgi:hypothetical protein
MEPIELLNSLLYQRALVRLPFKAGRLVNTPDAATRMQP